MELVVSSEHVERARRYGACHVPEPGTRISELSQSDLLWCEDVGLLSVDELTAAGVSTPLWCYSGYGDGYGSGDGYGDGYGSGSGYGYGYGYGDGDGYGSGYGYGYGYGDGDGYGYGDGDGSGSGYGSAYGSGYGENLRLPECQRDG